MNVKKYELELDYIDAEIESEKNFFKVKARWHKVVLILGTTSLITCIGGTYIFNKISGMDIFSISLTVVTLYSSIKDHLITKLDNQFKLTELETKKKHCEYMLEVEKTISEQKQILGR